MEWVEPLRARLRAQSVVVRVAIAQTRGSAPREAGAVILVDALGVSGTIGGGELEWRAERFARQMLDPTAPRVRIERWPLGPELGQCCGGSVTLWFERLDIGDLVFFDDLADRLRQGDRGWLLTRLHTSMGGQPEPGRSRGRPIRHWLDVPPDTMDSDVLLEPIAPAGPAVWLFGAGHVGRALAGILESLPYSLTVIDSRDSALAALASVRARRLKADEPQSLVREAPAGASIVVMTHSHEVDYAICRQALARRDLAWVGLIGSETKATCFRLRLSRDGVEDESIASLVSPIGLPGIRNKLPSVIAVSVAAQLLQTMR